MARAAILAIFARLMPSRDSSRAEYCTARAVGQALQPTLPNPGRPPQWEPDSLALCQSLHCVLAVLVGPFDFRDFRAEPGNRFRFEAFLRCVHESSIGVAWFFGKPKNQSIVTFFWERFNPSTYSR